MLARIPFSTAAGCHKAVPRAVQKFRDLSCSQLPFRRALDSRFGVLSAGHSPSYSAIAALLIWLPAM